MLTATGTNGRVFVFGSANHDHVLAVQEFPRSGETVLSHSYDNGLGGKGANQAVAAAAAGASVTFVGAVGCDEPGDGVIANFDAYGIDTRFTARTAEPTGVAVVLVDDDGSNEIVVSPGANAALPSAAVREALATVRPDDVIVVQCEIPVPRIEEVIRGGAETGATVVVNLAPYTALGDAEFAGIGLLVVNESEARSLSSADVAPADLATAVASSTGCDCVVTLGEHGSIFAQPRGGGVANVAASAVQEVVDTTGAGDVYVGTLAAHLARRDDITSAMQAASVAAARSVSTRGAQPRRTQTMPEPVV